LIQKHPDKIVSIKTAAKQRQMVLALDTQTQIDTEQQMVPG
jgi:hypothetical protein